MWNQQSPQNGEIIKKASVVVVAIDKDKGSQYALKWAVEHVLNKGQTVTLLHVKLKQSAYSTYSLPSLPLPGVNDDVSRSVRSYTESQTREIFIPYRCFCSRKDVKCNEVILEDNDISKALIDYSLHNNVEIMVVSASQKNGLLRRFKGPDVATSLAKGCPEFCSVYVISKSKMLYVRSATRTLPKANSPSHIQTQSSRSTANSPSFGGRDSGIPSRDSRDKSPFKLSDENLADAIRSPFNIGRATNGRAYGDAGMPDCDISFVGGTPPWATPERPRGGTPPWATPERSSCGTPPWATPDRSSGGTPPWATPERPSGGTPPWATPERPSVERQSFETSDYSSSLSSAYDPERLSLGSTIDRRSLDHNALSDFSGSLNNGYSTSSMITEEYETEMKRLRLELKQTMEMYNAACKEAITAKQMTSELQNLGHAHSSEEAALAVIEQEKAKSKAAIEAAESAQRLADLESKKRLHAERKCNRETEDKKAFENFSHNDVRYRKYSIDEIEAATNNFSESLKIGEGGYGPVYRCTLDHTPAAIKVLRPDAAQGESQFHQEVEILSCIRHPNMVLLLGACPEYGCLVYEYMANGSLEDRLFCKGNTPPLSWQIRFRAAAEIATGLLFLHQKKPEPLVHRDLKPANILLDRNFVSKISDVGLARLVPASVADSVTQYHMTNAAGTFCYIDPEYQQSGMLGTKSDIYSLGILYLQLITAKPAMGLAHHVQRAIERGTLGEVLDPAVPDWPYEEALELAKISLWCAELTKIDRPDLNQILPVLDRLRDFAEENMPNYMYY